MVLDFFVAAPGLEPDAAPLEPSALDEFSVPFGDTEQVFHIGPASVAVPGQLAGLIEAHRRFGRVDLAELVAPAVELARAGVQVTAEAAFLQRILGEMLTLTPGAAEIYAPRGQVLEAGELLTMPHLAETLEAVARDPVAGMLATLEAVSDGLGPRGRISRTDIDAYRVIEREPLRVRFRDYEVLTNPPPSWGGVLIGAALSDLHSRPPAADASTRSAEMVAAGFRANALREPGFAAILEDPERVRMMLAAPGRGPTGTTHISAVDADGCAAALSSSNGSGSGVVVGETGFLLNNMMGEADLNPEGFGKIAPGARPPSMMAPTIVLHGGRPTLALGSAGSNRIRSAILAVMLNLIDEDMSIADAVAAPRLHPEGAGVDVEAGVAAEIVGALEGAGHSLRRWGATSLFFGGASVAGATSGDLSAAGDHRRGGAAFGVADSGKVIQL